MFGDEGLGHSSYDAGFAVGARVAGILADLGSFKAAIYAVVALTALSGVVVIVRM